MSTRLYKDPQRSVVLALMVVLMTVVQSRYAAAQASAADTMKSRTPEVMITATRAESLSSPVTINELTRAEIGRQHTVFDVATMLSDLPSTISYSDNANGIGYSYLSIRGFDQRRIAVLINGIPQNDPEDHNVYWIDVPDLSASLDNIQVQRGAGLVNYGAAAIGGSINMSSVNIAQRRFAKLSIGAGIQEQSATGLNAAPGNISTLASTRSSIEFCSGLTDNKFAYYARVSQIQSRGYRDYSWAQLNSYFVSAGRFDDAVSLQLNVFGGPIADGLAYTGVPKAYIGDPVLRRVNYNYWVYDSTGARVDYAAQRRPNEQERFSQPHLELLSSVNISPRLTFESALFYYTGDGYFDYDASWADAATLRLTSAFGGSDTIPSPGNTLLRAAVANRQAGFIPHLRYTHADGELQVGGELRLHRSDRFATIAYAENLSAGFDPDFRVYSYNGKREIASIYARENYSFHSSLRITAEAQLVHSVYALENERAGRVYTQYRTTSGGTIANGAELFSVPYLFLNPRIGCLYTLASNQQLYMSLAHTQREPRMANLYAAEESFYSGSGPLFASDTVGGAVRYDFSRPLIKPETMLDLELGWKYTSTDLRAAVTFYLMDFRDELVKNGRRDIFGNPITGNAPHTRHLGCEVQADAVVWSQNRNSLHLAFNGTVSSNRILDYSYVVAAQSFDLSGNPVAAFPSLLSNLTLTGNFSDLRLSLTAKFRGQMYSDNFGDKLAGYRRTSPTDIPYADNVVDQNLVFNAYFSYELHNIASLSTLRCRVQCNNLFNTLYAAGANGAEFFPAAERNFFVALECEL